MNAPVQCARHGAAEASFVCSHIVETIDDGVARGFSWAVDEEGDHQSLCDDCHHKSHAMTDAQWEDHVAATGRILCLKCFWRAWEINGKPDSHHAH